MTTYRIHPAIGFARVGNSPDAWYVEPTAVGGLPTEPDTGEPVTEFKDRRPGQTPGSALSRLPLRGRSAARRSHTRATACAH